MATFKPLYDSSPTSLTVTNLLSLTNGSYWKSADIDNNTDLDLDKLIYVTINTGTSAAADALGVVEVYAAGSLDGGTDYEGGIAAGEGTVTFDVNGNPGESLRLLGVMPCDNSSTSSVVYEKVFSVAAAYGGFVPKNFIVVIKNSSGEAFHSAGCAVEVLGVQTQSV